MKRLLARAAVAASLAGAAAAQDAPPAPPPGGPPPRMEHGPPTRDAVADMVARGFARADANHDGVVTQAEFDRFRQQMEARRRARRDREFARLDTDRNGSVSRPEFDAPPPPPPVPDGHTPPAASSAPPPPPTGGPDGDGPHGGGRHMHGGMMGGMMSHQWFAEADANHDGKVTLAEAQAAALARFDAMDRNRDGKLDHEEMGPPPPLPGGDAPPPKG